jgi:GT2 family glycosyltransferase
MGASKQIVVLMTTHNRKESLKQALDALQNSARFADVSVRVYVANSGLQTMDYTHLESGTKFSVVEIPLAETSFWASSMRAAWEAYEKSGIPGDFILWLNEDTFLDDSGLQVLLRTAEESGREKIVVGSTRTRNHDYSYGGKKRAGGFLKLHFQDVLPLEDSTTECDTFNGNCVLVPSTIDDSLGGFPKGYSHLRADLAFGLLAHQRAIRSIVAPGFIAECEHNKSYPKYKDLAGASLLTRLKFVGDPKVGPLSEHIRFSLRFGGILGPLYAVAPILRSLIAR